MRRSMLMAVTVLALGMAAAARADQVSVFPASLAAAYENGVGASGQWLIFGAGADLADHSDATGVWFPCLPNWYGNSTAGMFGVRLAHVDERVPGGATITRVELHARIRAVTPTGNRIQFFSHRDLVGAEFGGLQINSYPLSQTPLSPPYEAFGVPWVNQDQWQDFVVVLPFTGTGSPWDYASLYNNCIGVWALPAASGGIYMSEWELRVTWH